MGRDKASLRLSESGPSLLEHKVGLLSGSCEPVVVSARAGQALGSLPERVVRVDDPADTPGGPLPAVVACLRRLVTSPATWAVCCAVDDVDLDAEIIARRVASVDAAPSTAWAVVGLDDEGRVQPMSAVFRVGAAYTVLEAALARGEGSLRRCLEGDGVERVRDFGPCRDVDTPEAWAAHKKSLAEGVTHK